MYQQLTRPLYTDFEVIAERLAAGMGTGSIMPKPAELAEALQYNYLLFLVPFVFYAFGWAFHIILELKHRFKFVFLGALITVTFVVDFLIALLIHNNLEYAKELMGIETKVVGRQSCFLDDPFPRIYCIHTLEYSSGFPVPGMGQTTYYIKSQKDHQTSPE